MREKLTVVSTVPGIVGSLASALAMQDHVRLVEVIGLFFGGFGSGAGVALLIARRGRRVVA